MMASFWRVPAVLIAGTFLVGLVAAAASGQVRNRALERALDGRQFSADDGTRVQRAFDAALHAGVRENVAVDFVEVCVSGGFDAAHLARVLSIVAQLQLERFPLDGVLTKIEEGVSKRVAPDRIVQAAERRGLMLTKAKGIINALVLQGIPVNNRDELLPDLAAALEAGRSPDEARTILSGALKAGEGSGSIRRKLFP